MLFDRVPGQQRLNSNHPEFHEFPKKCNNIYNAGALYDMW